MENDELESRGCSVRSLAERKSVSWPCPGMIPTTNSAARWQSGSTFRVQGHRHAALLLIASSHVADQCTVVTQPQDYWSAHIGLNRLEVPKHEQTFALQPKGRIKCSSISRQSRSSVHFDMKMIEASHSLSREISC